jgi:small subunit ribosomal protein S21
MINLTFVPHDPQGPDLAKRFTRACLKAGLFKEMKKRTFHEKPSLKKRRKQTEARKKAAKRARQYVVRLDGNGDPL